MTKEEIIEYFLSVREQIFTIRDDLAIIPPISDVKTNIEFVNTLSPALLIIESLIQDLGIDLVEYDKEKIEESQE